MWIFGASYEPFSMHTGVGAELKLEGAYGERKCIAEHKGNKSPPIVGTSQAKRQQFLILLVKSLNL